MLCPCLSLALCSLRAWSQTAPLFSCWDCWEVGRLDWGSVGWRKRHSVPRLHWPCVMPIKVKPGIKMDLQAQPSSAVAGWEVPWAAGVGGVQPVLRHWGGCVSSSPRPRGSPFSVPSILSALCSHLWAACPSLCFAARCGPSSQHLP